MSANSKRRVGKRRRCAALILAALGAGSAASGEDRVLTLDTSPEGQIVPLAYAPIYRDGTIGAWIPYGSTEGTPTCIGRGFDTYEPVLGGADPCANTSLVCENGATIICAPSCAGRNANGAMEGGVNPSCALGGDMPTCPVCAPRFGYTFAGSYAAAGYGSTAALLVPPAYAIGQPICAIDFSLYVGYPPGNTDLNGNVVGIVSYVDWVLHDVGFPADCATATPPLLGPRLGSPGGAGAIPGGFRFAYNTPTTIGPTGARFRFGPIDLSAADPPLTMPAAGSYEVLFWKDAAGTIVSGNNQAALWSPKDPAQQGSTSAIVLRNNDFSAPASDTGDQYDLSLAGECHVAPSPLCAAELGGLPLVPTVRLGVPAGPTPVAIVAANPPNLHRDTLQNTTAALVSQGIGAPNTPNEGSVAYSRIAVTFSATPPVTPSSTNIALSCTDIAGNGQADCPTISAASGSGAGPYLLTLSGSIPVRECTTFIFTGTLAGQKLQYQFLPGDINLSGTVTAQDLLAQVADINHGTANALLARLDTNRSGQVTGQDVLRLVQLLNGGASVSPPSGYSGAAMAPCE